MVFTVFPWFVHMTGRASSVCTDFRKWPPSRQGRMLEVLYRRGCCWSACKKHWVGCSHDWLTSAVSSDLELEVLETDSAHDGYVFLICVIYAPILIWVFSQWLTMNFSFFKLTNVRGRMPWAGKTEGQPTAHQQRTKSPQAGTHWRWGWGLTAYRTLEWRGSLPRKSVPWLGIEKNAP